MKKLFLLCLVAFMSMGFVHAEGKFYLKPSVQWLLGDEPYEAPVEAAFGATFKDAVGNESELVRFISTEINPYIYELDIPAGDWTQIRPRRYTFDWEEEAEMTAVGYSTYGSNNLITTVEWDETYLSTYTPPVLSDVKFYLDITESKWEAPFVLNESFFTATFYSADNSAGHEIVFKPTIIPTIYEVNVPVGNINKVLVERYLTHTLASSGNDQRAEYSYDGTANCALVVDWMLESYLLNYTPIVFSNTKFYLDVTGSAWGEPGVLEESFFKAAFYDADNYATHEVRFTPTAVPTVFEVNVPVGNITNVRVDRYLLSTQASAGADQGEEYSYDGTYNCAVVMDWVLALSLTIYEPSSIPTVGLVDTKIHVKGNQIIASFSECADVKLYTITGQLLRANQTSDFTHTVSSTGLYLLTVNGQVHKVLVP